MNPKTTILFIGGTQTIGAYLSASLAALGFEVGVIDQYVPEKFDHLCRYHQLIKNYLKG